MLVAGALFATTRLSVCPFNSSRPSRIFLETSRGRDNSLCVILGFTCNDVIDFNLCPQVSQFHRETEHTRRISIPIVAIHPLTDEPCVTFPLNSTGVTERHFDWRAP
jgi:hypothetical protein